MMYYYFHIIYFMNLQTGQIFQKKKLTSISLKILTKRAKCCASSYLRDIYSLDFHWIFQTSRVKDKEIDTQKSVTQDTCNIIYHLF